MARFFGTVQGGRGRATRLGHADTGLDVEAQSYSGNVAIRMYVENDVDCVRIVAHAHSNTWQGRTLYDGPVRALIEHDLGFLLAKQAIVRKAKEIAA